MLFFFYFALALQLQDNGPVIKKIDDQLSKGSVTINAVLTDPAYMDLHSLTEFRNVIRKHAKAAPLHITTTKEPGNTTTVKVKLVSQQAAMPNTLVYVYQTDHRGWYSADKPHVEQNEGDRGHARLFGYVRTNSNGEFELKTIRPASYPNSTLPQHIHLEAFNDAGRSLIITELLFDDDPGLVGETRTEFLRQFFVAKNTGTQDNQQFSYVVNIRN